MKKVYWTSRDKRKILICKMDHEHVLNVLLLLQRNGHKHWVKQSRIYKALVRRLKKFESENIVKRVKWVRK